MNDDSEVARAVTALARGELVVFPTETLYAIACDALDAKALERLCAAKRRPAEKGLAVIIADHAMLAQITTRLPREAGQVARAFWPGPLTILAPARAGLPDPIVRDGKIGCRISSHPLATRLSRELGRPIAVPSANPADLEPAADVAAARAYFGDAVAVYLEGGVRRGAPSTLVDAGPPMRILRDGAIPAARVEAVLRARSRG